MIKEVYRDKGGSLWEIKCDSCHILMAECEGFQWIKGKELIYSPILCESCGTERSKDHGAKTKRVEELEKQLKNLVNEHESGWQRNQRG